MIPSGFERDVAEIERRAVELASELHPVAVPLADAGRLYDRLDRAARALAAAKVLLAPRVAESREWRSRGHRSPEEDLAARSGTSLAAAKSAMATGKALAGNAELRSAMSRGEVSPDQGSVIADAARVDPGATDKLIATAKEAGLNELRNQAGRVKAAADKDPDATYRRLYRARRLSRFTDAEGARHLHLQGPVDLVSVIEAELDRCLSHHIRTMDPGRPIESRDTMAFDAAIAMARRSARADQADTGQSTDGDTPTVPGEGVSIAGNGAAWAGTGPRRSATDSPGSDQSGATRSGVGRSGSSPSRSGQARSSSPGSDADGSRSAGPGSVPRVPRRRARQAAPEHLALLRIDIEALWRGHVTGDEVCEIAGLGPFPVSAAQRLLGDAVVKLIITKGNAVAHVTSLTRGPTQSMRYALLWTNPECTAQGCTCTILEADHRFGAEYKDTHRTRLDELDPLCHAHHALRTHKGWALVEGTGKRPIVGPNDPRHPGNTGASPPGDRPGPDPPRPDRARPVSPRDGTVPPRADRPPSAVQTGPEPAPVAG